MAPPSTAPSINEFSPTASVRSSSRRWMEDVPPVEVGLDDNPSSPTPTLCINPNVKRSVSINYTALEKLATEITKSIIDNKSLEVAEWDADGWHYTGTGYQGGHAKNNDANSEFRELMRMERVALYILTMDAINFCFWPVSSNYAEVKNMKNCLEYEHLAIALRKVAELDDNKYDGNNATVENCTTIRASSSYPLCPANLAALTPDKMQSLLEPHFPPSTASMHYELPNIETRCKLLNELGRGLLDHHDGSALHMIFKANQSADALVHIIMDSFSGFRDFVDTKDWDNPSSTTCEWEVAKYSSSVIHLYKRAQIAVADIWAALGRCNHDPSPSNTASSISTLLSKCCCFTDMNLVTTFPDYRVPQILRNVGVMKYGSSLANLVDNQVELEKSGMDEVSIRAGTVVAVEDLVQKVKEKLANIAAGGQLENRNNLRALAGDVSAVTIDWYLWQQGEKLDRQDLLEPHHRVCTTFY